MNANIASLLFLACGVLFILALRGLSSPVTSRRGNQMGMAGMAIAVGVTLATLWSTGMLDAITVGLIGAGVVVGGTIGAIIARRVAMTAMPQLVAAFHSLVGLAACMVAVAAIYSPAAYHIDEGGGIKLESLIELAVGLAIGAITFTGSLIAFAKLNGNMSGAPIKLPARHTLNVAIALAIVALARASAAAASARREPACSAAAARELPPLRLSLPLQRPAVSRLAPASAANGGVPALRERGRQKADVIWLALCSRFLPLLSLRRFVLAAELVVTAIAH